MFDFSPGLICFFGPLLKYPSLVLKKKNSSDLKSISFFVLCKYFWILVQYSLHKQEKLLSEVKLRVLTNSMKLLEICKMPNLHFWIIQFSIRFMWALFILLTIKPNSRTPSMDNFQDFWHCLNWLSSSPLYFALWAALSLSFFPFKNHKFGTSIWIKAMFLGPMIPSIYDVIKFC